MAKKDPAKTARNRRIVEIGEELKDRLDDVLAITGCENVHVWHGKVGSKNQQFVNVKTRAYFSEQEYISAWYAGLKAEILRTPTRRREESAICELGHWLQDEPKVRKYTHLFLERLFLNNYEEIARVKPAAEEAELWFGGKNSEYGLFVAPRFAEGQWENDKSEIRRFKKKYWTVGHVIATGLVLPDEERVFPFANVEALLAFYRNALVRGTGSPYQMQIADQYCAYVRAAEDAESVPFLVPELRFGGKVRDHLYRLDFCVIHPLTLSKYGFELSPYSTHGDVKGLTKKTAGQVRGERKAMFEKEAAKARRFFIDRQIPVLSFTDTDLADTAKVFGVMARYMEAAPPGKQLMLHALEDFKNFDIDSEVLEDDEDAQE